MDQSPPFSRLPGALWRLLRRFGAQESLEEDIERYKPQSLDDLAGEMRDTAKVYNRGRERGGERDWER